MRKVLLFILSMVPLLMLAQGEHHHGRRPRPMRGQVVTTPYVHDPVMAREDSTFYIYYTGMEIGQLSSTDLKQWRFERPVLFGAPQWAMDSVRGYRGHTWAPDIVHRDSLYHLYYSCSTFGKNTSVIGHAQKQTLNPDTPWEDTGWVIGSHSKDDYNAIDPAVIIDDEGQPWMFFGSFWGGIQLVRLADDMQHTAEGTKPVCVAKRSHGKAIEAPFCFRHGDYYYLFVSWDLCCRGTESTYKVAVGRSKSIDGPYVDKDGKRMLKGGGTLLFEGDETYVAGGHCAAYTFDGVDYFICHGYRRDNGDSELILRKITWTDGWPILVHNS